MRLFLMRARNKKLAAKIAAAAMLCVAAGCAPSGDNFSQFADFDSIRAALQGAPPPNAHQRALLQCHRPLLYIAPGEEGLIDFYADYIGSGELFAEGQSPIKNPDAAALNAVRDQPQAVFVHKPSARKAKKAAVYGGFYRATLTLAGGESQVLDFLSYHFVFRHSGLPAGVPQVARQLADIVADSRDWHQLDHYTAAFVVLYNNAPFAILLQQHNYMRTYFIGEEPAFADGRAVLDAAIFSNELYPHRRGQHERRAAGSLHSRTAAYLTGGEEGGFFTAADITFGDGQVADYELQFLPPDDAFYVFEGRLGEARLLPGRDGPPGAIYRSSPKLWAPEKSLYAFYWTDEDAEYARILTDEGYSVAAMAQYLQRFSHRQKEMVQKNAGKFANLCPAAEEGFINH